MRASAFSVLCIFTLASCSYPLDRARTTPLQEVSANYLTLHSGVPLLLGTTASAVLVGDGIAVTNRHVVESSIGPLYAVRGGATHAVRVMARSGAMDLAVLEAPGLAAPSVRWAEATLDAPVWAMGTPILSAPVARGRVENLAAWYCSRPQAEAGDGDCRGHTGLMLRADGAAGYSGGPVVDAEGRMVGLVAARFLEVFDATGRPLNDGAPRLFAYPMATVMAEVERLLADRPPLLARLEARPAEVPAESAETQVAAGL